MHADPWLELGPVGVSEFPQVEIGLREVFRQQTEAGTLRRPSPALVLNVDDLHLQGVTGLCAADEHRARQRVDQVEVQLLDRRHVGVRCDLLAEGIHKPRRA